MSVLHLLLLLFSLALSTLPPLTSSLSSSSSSSSTPFPVLSLLSSSSSSSSSSLSLSSSPSTRSLSSSASPSVPPPTGQVTGDPQFCGLRGQQYQVHGVHGAVYNLLTQHNMQLNARFSFLHNGRCPVIGGVESTVDCWSHPGSYLGELGLQYRDEAGERHTAVIVAGEANVGFERVEVDGRQVAVGGRVELPGFALNFRATHSLVIRTADFTVRLSNSDRFLNQQLAANTPLFDLTCHGLLGQTHRGRVYPTALKYIEGEVDDYLIEDGQLLGNEVVFNLFTL